MKKNHYSKGTDTKPQGIILKLCNTVILIFQSSFSIPFLDSQCHLRNPKWIYLASVTTSWERFLVRARVHRKIVAYEVIRNTIHEYNGSELTVISPISVKPVLQIPEWRENLREVRGYAASGQ